MSTVRIQTGDVEEIRSRFVDAQGAGVTGLSPTVRIWRVSDGQFWNGTGYAAAPTDHPMAAVDAANLPGVYAYDFDTSGGSGASEEEHGVLASTTSGSVINSAQEASVHVGGFIDNLDAQISPIAEALVGRIDIDITADPWRENHYDLATRTSIVRSFDLFDQDGNAINGNDGTGNNPLNDPSRIIADRRLV